VFAARHEAGPGSETELWCVEDFNAAAAEVGAELGQSRFRAEADMCRGLTLVHRLPRLAQRFLAGEVDLRVIALIDNRTTLVQDPGVLAELDARLAEAAPRCNALSREKLTEVVDWLVVELDPEAKRVARTRHDDRHVDITPGEHGLSEMHGRLSATDGAALDKRLDAIAATVCRNDPRTTAQRRVDGLMALSERHDTLDCRCGQDQCPVAPTPAPNAPTQVIVHVLAEQATVDGTGDTPAYLPGHGPVPAAAVRELVGTGRATTRPLIVPAADTPPEPGYRPSRALSAFLMFRDLTCRFPGCSHPAEKCDYDHTVPWPQGRTHPGNLKAYCRHHHLLKTFWGGPGGWNDVQYRDGTIEFTSPSGRRYTTTPLGASFFPQLATPTGDHQPRGAPPPETPAKTWAMPRRRRSRAADKAARIAQERAINRATMNAHTPPF
jgi:hypothetical protein